jgi:hypothetical protein
MSSYTITNLLNEQGPSQPVTLQWATYFDAADQVGISRIWGGIHPPVDDFAGRLVGAACGQGVWALARKYFDGSVTNVSATLAIRSLNTTQSEVRGETLRGFFYQLQSTTDLRQAFTNDPGGFVQAFDSSLARTNDLSVGSKFFRLLSRPVP